MLSLRRLVIWGAVAFAVFLSFHISFRNTREIEIIENDPDMALYWRKTTSGLSQKLLNTQTAQNADPEPEPRSEETNNQTLFFSRDISTYINLLDAKPPQYLDNFKNPCWVEERPPSSPYKQNPFFKIERQEVGMKEIEELWMSEENQNFKTEIRCLPYFYVAGFPKCGTSDVFDKISLHPDVEYPTNKEIHWWSNRRLKKNKDANSVWIPISMYVDLFDAAARSISKETPSLGDYMGQNHSKIVGEGSPSTVYAFRLSLTRPENAGFTEPHFITPHYIHHVTPDVRIIVLVRNPTSRLYSSYIYFGDIETCSSEDFHEKVVVSIGGWESCLSVATSHWDCLFNTTLRKLPLMNDLTIGMFHYYIKEWFDVFPKNQIMIVPLEDYGTNRTSVLTDVFHFLGLRSLTRKETSEIDNEAIKNKMSDKKKISSGPMLKKTKELLDKFYAQHNKALAELLGDDRFSYT